MLRVRRLLLAVIPALALAGCATGAGESAASPTDDFVSQQSGIQWHGDQSPMDGDTSKFDDGSFLQGGW